MSRHQHQTLYSLRTDPNGYRITKFVDGEVESSYLTSHEACECPAGHRHTCRHRQMLPTMLAHQLADSLWFFDFDHGGQIVDFNGTSKRLFDELAAIEAPKHADQLVGANPASEQSTPVIDLQRNAWRRL